MYIAFKEETAVAISTGLIAVPHAKGGHRVVIVRVVPLAHAHVFMLRARPVLSHWLQLPDDVGATGAGDVNRAWLVWATARALGDARVDKLSECRRRLDVVRLLDMFARLM